jgi:hypothetical protein
VSLFLRLIHFGTNFSSKPVFYTIKVSFEKVKALK